jgi:hypothetical protein
MVLLMQSQLDLDDGVATVTGTTGLQFAGSIALKTVIAFASTWAAFYAIIAIRREEKEMAGWWIWLSIPVSTRFPEFKVCALS